MAPTMVTDRRERVRDGVLEILGDITYAILRKYDIGNHAPMAALADASTPAKA